MTRVVACDNENPFRFARVVEKVGHRGFLHPTSGHRGSRWNAMHESVTNDDGTAF